MEGILGCRKNEEEEEEDAELGRAGFFNADAMRVGDPILRASEKRSAIRLIEQVKKQRRSDPDRVSK